MNLFGYRVFLFRDGPLTLAAKGVQPIVFEDIDQPQAGTTERINTLIECPPSFRCVYAVQHNGQGSRLHSVECHCTQQHWMTLRVPFMYLRRVQCRGGHLMAGLNPPIDWVPSLWRAVK